MSKILALYFAGINNQEALDEYKKIVIKFKVKKRTLIFKEGDIDTFLYLIESGLVRQYYYKNNGPEITEFLAFENQGFGCIESAFTNKPSYLNAEALEDSVLYKIPMDKLKELCLMYREIELHYRKNLEYMLVLTQLRMKNIQFNTALERYQNLLKENPTIIQRVSSMYIASYLGITPETLSRIKSM